MFLRIASSNQHHMYIKSKLENHACNFRPNLWYKFLLLFLSHVLKSQPQAEACSLQQRGQGNFKLAANSD